jgi:hypothetical protein
MLLTLTALPALAQETEADITTWRGLGGGMVVFGLFCAVAVGFYMAYRESNGDENDLV